jgi:uroporphyrinogen decarboxylase
MFGEMKEITKMSEIQPIRPKWKGTLTDRERFVRQMHYQPVDRCFNMEFGYWEENFSEWDLFRDHNITNNEQADIFFNFDRTASIGGSIWMDPPFPNQVVEVRDKTKLLINSDGLLAEVPLDGHDTIPHYIKASIVTPDDWKKVKAERFSLHSSTRVLDIAALKNQVPSERDYPLGVWVGSMIGKIRDMLTFEGLAYSIYDYPLMVEDMVETACQLVEQSLDQILPHFQFDYAAGWEDICYKSGPIVSPKWFHRVITPRYARIHQKLKSYGIDIWWIDCDGDVRPILPFMMEGGVNCLFPFEVNGCAHPAELLQEYGKDLRIMGGFDKIEMGKGRDAIRRYMDTLVPLVERGGYIPFCDHRCPPNVTPDDYLYYLDLKEQYFGLK